jgi:membrane protein implicated in regulation of membrane protease activity
MRVWRFASSVLLALISLALVAGAVHWRLPLWATWWTVQTVVFATIALAEVQHWQRRRRERRAGWKPFGPI